MFIYLKYIIKYHLILLDSKKGGIKFENFKAS